MTQTQNLMIADASRDGYVDALFHSLRIEHQSALPFTLLYKWITSSQPNTDNLPGGILTWSDHLFSSEAVLELEGNYWTFYFHHLSREMKVLIAARSQASARGVLQKILNVLPRDEPSRRGEVPIGFWSHSKNGPQKMTRMLTAHEWPIVAKNYPGSTHQQLNHLIWQFKPSRGGQLLLWHGPPGTGKTHALRALAWEWRNWAKFEYITDPDVLFGKEAHYLISVLIDSEGPEQQDDHWRVLILEDAGEMLSADAKERSNQGFSRLLNVVDGLIGQGLRILVLITTNEDVTSFHPAISRPGRCAMNVKFDKFSPDEAVAWWAKQDLPAEAIKKGQVRPTSAISLAEMYAQVGGYYVPARKLESVGFQSH